MEPLEQSAIGGRSAKVVAAGYDARCTVGLLTWNAGGDGERCVASLLDQTEPVNIVWTDNGSTDDTVARLRVKYGKLPRPKIHSRNLGFCAPHNEMIARCRTPYYLALNQDVVLAPGYIERLCDFMDAHEGIGLAAGLMLLPNAAQNELSPRAWESLFQGYLSTIGRQGEAGRTQLTPIVQSAGLVFPRNRCYYHLGIGAPPRAEHAMARRVPGVDGAAMMLKVGACRRASLPPEDIFPASFFAYGEEIDLALRLARTGVGCGIEPGALALHRGKGSGGHAHMGIRARYFANHWLLTLRHDSLGTIAKDLPYIVKGELQYWLSEYLRHPPALLLALGLAMAGMAAARRFYRQFERRFGPTGDRVRQYKLESLGELCGPRRTDRALRRKGM